MKQEIGLIIGDRNKIDMILGLFQSGSSKKTDVYAFTTNNNLNARKLDELERVGIIAMVHDRFDNNRTIVDLTSEGRAIASKLIEIEGILSGEIVPTDDAETDYNTSTQQGDTVN